MKRECIRTEQRCDKQANVGGSVTYCRGRGPCVFDGKARKPVKRRSRLSAIDDSKLKLLWDDMVDASETHQATCKTVNAAQAANTRAWERLCRIQLAYKALKARIEARKAKGGK